MPVAKMTSKGQVTIPKEVRAALGLEPGDRIDFRIAKGGAEIKRQASLADLSGTVPVPDEVRGKSWDEIRALAMRQRTKNWEAKARRLAD